jgi:glutaredoxin
MTPHSIASRTRLPSKSRLACALAACLLVQSPLVFAQSTSATLKGRVTADAAPASGAQVTATNVATGFTRTVQSSPSGEYMLNGLPPGSYRIDVNAGGKTSSRTILLQVGQTATVGLGVGGAAPPSLGAVVVTGVAMPETKTSEVATYVTTKQIEALPQGSRNFLAFADTVPGMAFTTTGTASKLRGGAQNSNGINVFLDGVGQKNYVIKGGVTGQDSSRGNPFPQLGIAEYKVITSNYKAELDQLSSAAVVAVTRSGTNEFHGDVFYDFNNQSLNAETPFETHVQHEKTDSFEKQYGVSVGGPIIKDIAHFFFTYERKDFSTPNSFTPGQNLTIDQLPTEFQDQARATSASPFQEDLYFAKVDWSVGDDHLFELSARRRSEDELTGLGGSTLNDHGTLKSGDETRVDLRWQWNGRNFLNDAHLTYEDASFGPRPALIGPGYVLTTADRNQTILTGGGGRDFQDKGQKGTALQDDLTFNSFDWNGGHTIKAGFKFKTVELNAFEQQPYNAQFFYDVNESLTVPYLVQFGSPVGGVDRNITSRNQQFGAYIQDDWEVNDHLLLNLGMRWDYEKSPGYLDYVTPAGLAAALRGWSNLHAPGVDYDVEDYISDGSSRKAFKGAWQPRLGFSYDLDADQRHVIFGGAGRSYDRNLWDYLALEQNKSTFPSYEYQFNTEDHPCTGDKCLDWNASYLDQGNLDALVASNRNLGAEVNLVNNDLKTPYSDQFSLGMRNVFGMFGRDWNSSVTLLHVASHDGIIIANGGRYANGGFRDPNCGNATWGCAPWGQTIPGYGGFFTISNGIETKLDSVLMSLEKPYTKDSPWSVNFAYTYSDGHENRSNAYESDEHFSGDYPNPGEEGFHPTIGLPRHRLVVTGFVDGAWGMTYSAKLALASPKPQDATNCLDAIDGNHCFFDPWTPGYAIGNKQLDVAVQKTVDFTEDMHLRFRVDVINAFNWHNWTDYSNWRGFVGSADPNFGLRTGYGTAYPPRMIKATVGFTW